MYHRLALLAFCVSLAASPCAAQERIDTTPGHQSPAVGGPKYKKDKTPTSRTVRGTVTDDTGQPVKGALVTLTDMQTKDKLTFITKADGRYHFEDLSFTKDYELSAIYQKMSSATRKLSQYDRTAEVVRVLELAENNPPVPSKNQ